MEDIIKIVENTQLNHIAIIMDGNRRWAKERMLPSMMGHKMGVEALKKTVKACNDFKIKYLTVYAFSTENWNRKKEEVDFLMNLLAQTLKNELEELNQNDVKMNFIGDIEGLNPALQEILKHSKEKTKDNKGVVLTVAINYGAKDELIHCVQNIIDKGIRHVDEQTIQQNLYTNNLPDPDFLIRTSGEKRISNFLLWQIAYSEIYVIDKYWPEFDKDELKKAILEFGLRKRRYGK